MIGEDKMTAKTVTWDARTRKRVYVWLALVLLWTLLLFNLRWGFLYSTVDEQEFIQSKVEPSTAESQDMVDTQQQSICQQGGLCQGPVFDVLSIGSIHRTDLQEAQRETLRQSPIANSIRHFFAANEHNDTDQDCHSKLTWDDVKRISFLCRKSRTKQRAPALARMVSGFASLRYLQKKTNPVGWMCAQKRPPVAFWNILQKYRLSSNGHHTLPDYLIIMDDDTWIQMETLKSDLVQNFDAQKPAMVAGCLISVEQGSFDFPFGGYGTIFTRAALERWMTPLNGCLLPRERQRLAEIQNTTVAALDFSFQSPFVRHACERVTSHRRLGENLRLARAVSRQRENVLRGEGRQAPTIADVMYSYTQRANYSKVKEWDDLGYCLHSDWIIGFFAGEYNITENGRILPFKGSQIGHNLRTGECHHTTVDTCDKNATICHYMTPEAMRNRLPAT